MLRTKEAEGVHVRVLNWPTVGHWYSSSLPIGSPPPSSCTLPHLHLSFFTCRASLGWKVCWKWPSATEDTQVFVLCRVL